MSFAFGNLLRVFFFFYYTIWSESKIVWSVFRIHYMKCSWIVSTWPKRSSTFKGMTICVALMLWLAPYRRAEHRETNIKRADTINRNLWRPVANASLHFHSQEWRPQLDTLHGNYSKSTEIGSKLSEPFNGSNVTNSRKDTHLLLLLGSIPRNLYASDSTIGSSQSWSANSFKVIKYKQFAKLFARQHFMNCVAFVLNVIISRLMLLINFSYAQMCFSMWFWAMWKYALCSQTLNLLLNSIFNPCKNCVHVHFVRVNFQLPNYFIASHLSHKMRQNMQTNFVRFSPETAA